MDLIPSDNLTVDMLPGSEATENDFFVFALTFNGYEALADCAEIANKSVRAFAEHGTLPESLDELRGCLFYEQRRKRHCDSDACEEDLRYYNALVDAMRTIITTQTFE